MKRDRVAAKFVENEFEKCDRLMEVFFQYERSLTAAEARLAQTGEANADIIDSTRGSAGLYVLQQVRGRCRARTHSRPPVSHSAAELSSPPPA